MNFGHEFTSTNGLGVYSACKDELLQEERLFDQQRRLICVT